MRVRLQSCLILAALAGLAVPGPRRALLAQAGAPAERGTFSLYKFERAIGEERYEIEPAGDGGGRLSSSFTFTDRGTVVPLTTQFEFQAGLAPARLTISGRTARISTIDAEVTIANGVARIKDAASTREENVPPDAFLLAGYAPPSMQMELLRFWLSRGRPETVPLLPRGAARITFRGRDQIAAGGRTWTFDRYSVAGIVWGRETLWVDDSGRLAALVCVDAEFDHFEAVRPELEDAVPMFVARAAADGMAAMAETAAAEAPPAAETIAVVGATIVDGSERPPIANGAVVIEKGRIAAVGPRDQVAVPRDAVVVAAEGKTIIPGLWDMHSHFEQVEWGPIYLASGVTTVRDVGNELEFVQAVRDAIDAGRGLGPRLLLAGIIDGGGSRSMGVITADTPDEARARVNRYHDAKFDQIKVYSSVQLDVLRAITREAHRLGMTVTGHVPNGIDTLQAIDAGLDQVNHVEYIVTALNPQPQRAIETLRQHHTVVDPTLALYELLARPFNEPIVKFEPGVAKVAPELAAPLNGFGSPTDVASRRRAEQDERVAAVRRLHAAGIPIVAGTDQAVPGHSLHREIELYVAAGFTPLEALQAATIVPARVMKKDAESGTIENGKRGDLVILDANPLELITNTRRIYRVITNGRVFDPAPLWRSVGFQP